MDDRFHYEVASILVAFCYVMDLILQGFMMICHLNSILTIGCDGPALSIFVSSSQRKNIPIPCRPWVVNLPKLHLSAQLYQIQDESDPQVQMKQTSQSNQSESKHRSNPPAAFCMLSSWSLAFGAESFTTALTGYPPAHLLLEDLALCGVSCTFSCRLVSWSLLLGAIFRILEAVGTVRFWNVTVCHGDCLKTHLPFCIIACVLVVWFSLLHTWRLVASMEPHIIHALFWHWLMDLGAFQTGGQGPKPHGPCFNCNYLLCHGTKSCGTKSCLE